MLYIHISFSHSIGHVSSNHFILILFCTYFSADYFKTIAYAFYSRINTNVGWLSGENEVANCSVGGFNKTQLNISTFKISFAGQKDAATVFLLHGAGLRVATSLFWFSTNKKAPSFATLVTGAVILWYVQMAASRDVLDVHSRFCVFCGSDVMEL